MAIMKAVAKALGDKAVVEKMRAAVDGPQAAQPKGMAIALIKKLKENQNQSGIAKKLSRMAFAPVAAMKKGGAVKKKVTVKAKPVVKAKARKK
jgi:hypothetical protein